MIVLNFLNDVNWFNEYMNYQMPLWRRIMLRLFAYKSIKKFRKIITEYEQSGSVGKYYAPNGTVIEYPYSRELIRQSTRVAFDAIFPVHWENTNHNGQELVKTFIEHNGKIVGYVTKVDEQYIHGNVIAEVISSNVSINPDCPFDSWEIRW